MSGPFSRLDHGFLEEAAPPSERMRGVIGCLGGLVFLALALFWLGVLLGWWSP